MNILIVVNGRFPAYLYGGTERVMWSLGKALAQIGHRVTFLADVVSSECSFAKMMQKNPDKSIYEQIPHETDVVHFNEFRVQPELMPCPYVNTIHGNRVDDKIDNNSIFVSRNHALRNGCDSWVHNGLDWDMAGKIDLSLERKRYHFLGKAAWRLKNVKGAIEVATNVRGGSIDVLGGNRLNIKMGFRFTLSPKAHFHGMVDDATKYAIMQKSRGLVFPVKWHEPFGLAVIESLYAGCPVFATPYGALPELVCDKRFGFLSNSAKEMVSVMNEFEWNSKECHDYALETFSAMAMAKAYLEKYEKVLNGEMLIKEFSHKDEMWRGLEWNE